MKIKLTFILFFFMLSACFSQSLFNKGYQFGIPPLYLKIIQLPDKGYFLFGGSEYPAAGFLGKIDLNGVMLWGSKYEYSNSSATAPPVFGSAIYDYEQHILMPSQGSYPNTGSLLKSDTNGNIIWDLRFDFPVTNVLIASDSNYVVLGHKNIAVFGQNAEIQFYKISPSGSVIYGYEYFNPNGFINYNNLDKDTYGLIEYADGNFYVLANVNGDIFVMKMNATGQVTWNKKYYQSGSLYNYVISPTTWKMILMPDSTLLICGRSYYPVTNEIICFKINSNGNILWSKKYLSGTSKSGLENAFLNSENMVVLFVALADSGDYINDHAVLLIDQDGDLLNNFSFRSTDNPVYPIWFEQDNSAHYHLIQNSGLEPVNNYDTIQITNMDSLFQSSCLSDTAGPFTMQNFSISVLDSFPLITQPSGTLPFFDTLVITPKIISNYDFCSPTGINVLKKADDDLSIYPNPAREFINIDFTFQKSNSAYLKILNPLGEIIYCEALKNNRSKNLQRISLENFAAGLYFIEIKNDDKIFSGKFIVE